MEIIIASLIALTAGMVAYQVWPLPSGYWGKSLGNTLAAHAPEPELPFWRGLLSAFKPIVKYTPLGWTRAIDSQLYWAQLVGKWQGWALPEVIALHVAIGGVGAVLGGLVGGDVTLALAAMAALPFLLNLIYLNAPARRARRQLAAELPEFVSLLAAEVGADTTLSEAIVRLSRGPGVCAAWFRRVLSLKGIGGLFTEGNIGGALREEARRSGDSDLIGLATSLDGVKRRGTGTRELLSQIATSTASRYIGEAQMRAEKVGSEIILPMIFFFFFPYIVVILLVMAAPIFSGGLF
jgi:Flp pilus assembly protein TadB